MLTAWIKRAVLMAGVAIFFCGMNQTAQADQWNRHYHWPYGNQGQYQWSPYQQQRVYDGRYRYPANRRWLPQQGHHRNWLAVPKPYYRGYHFILDQF